MRSGPDSLHSPGTRPERGLVARRIIASLLLLGVSAYYLWLGFQPGEFKAFQVARTPWALATLSTLAAAGLHRNTASAQAAARGAAIAASCVVFTFLWLGKLAMWTYAPPMMLGFAAVAVLGLSGFDDEALQVGRLRVPLIGALVGACTMAAFILCVIAARFFGPHDAGLKYVPEVLLFIGAAAGLARGKVGGLFVLAIATIVLIAQGPSDVRPADLFVVDIPLALSLPVLVAMLAARRSKVSDEHQTPPDDRE